MGHTATSMGGFHPRAGNHYQEMQIKTADSLELILILYGQASHNLRLAQAHLASGDIQQRFAAMDKAISMIGELQTALDFEKGGEIAVSLDRLYDYLLRRLTEANANRDPAPLEEVIRLLGMLESAWQEVKGRSGTALRKGNESG